MSKKTSIFAVILCGVGAILALYMISIYYSTKYLTQNLSDVSTGESVRDVLDGLLESSADALVDEGDASQDPSESSRVSSVEDEGDSQDARSNAQKRKTLSRHISTLIDGTGVTADIDREEIENGGVGVDGIPAIDRPLYASITQAPEWLLAKGDGLLVEREEGGKQVARFYPYQVLVSHEIVNDVFADEKLLVTYCPLCFTGVIYDISDTRYGEFGVSGYLWESNLLMYNRPTLSSDASVVEDVSLWSQALGRAVVGKRVGEKLPVAQFDITTYEKFAQSFPEGEVLIGEQLEEGQSTRKYDRVPYGGNLRDITPLFNFSGTGDTRLPKTEIISGLEVNGKFRAYPSDQIIGELVSLGSEAVIIDELGGKEVQITYNDETGVLAFRDVASRERLTPIPSFWISWVSLNPETTVYEVN